MTDPVFVSIETRNQMHAAHEAACKALSEYENSHRTPEGWLPVDEVVRALDEKANETCWADSRALRALLSTRPTTLAGVIALLEYVRARQDNDPFLTDNLRRSQSAPCTRVGSLEGNRNSGRDDADPGRHRHADQSR
jgi:hypothetical protein